ncbi:MAG TPA: hypothetical protein VK506_12575 [Conexibacter sp.]|nr:hypothetical protein [Conexibacter sp.]
MEQGSVKLAHAEVAPAAIDWRDVRRRARRRSLRRAAVLLACFPPAIVITVYELINEGNDVAAFLGWMRYVALAFAVFAVIVLASFAIAELSSIARGDPLVLRADVLGASDSMPDSQRPSALALHRLFGLELLVDVGGALRIGADGATSPDDESLGCITITATARMHKRAKPGDEVVLVCTSNRRAFATLAELAESRPSDA